MKRNIISILLNQFRRIPLPALLLCLCSVIQLFPVQTHADPQKTETVILQLNWKHQFEYAGIYAAVEKGFYTQYGLNVIIREHTPTKVPVHEVLEGRANYGIWVSSLILERMKGKPVVLLANYFKHSPLVILSKPSIRFPVQLRGKTIMGIPEDNEIAEIAYLLMSNGVGKDDVTWIPHTYDPWRVVNGDVDAMTAYLTNQPYELHKKGAAFTILDPANYGADFYGDSLFTSETEIRKHPYRTRRFITATTRGWDYAIKNPDEIISLILKKYSDKKSREALEYEATATIDLIQPDLYQVGSTDDVRIQRIADIFLSLGMVDRIRNLDDFLYNPDLKTGVSDRSLSLTTDEVAYIRNNPVIHVSNEFDWPPFDFTIAGNPEGFGIDLMNLLAEKTGLSIRYVNGYTWAELLTMFYDGELDVAHSLSKTPEREAEALFSSPYHHSKKVLVVRSDTQGTDSLTDLEGKIIALPEAWSTIPHLRKNHPKIHIIEVDNSRQAFEYVDQGKVSATIELESIADYIIKKYGFSDLKRSRWIDDPGLQDTASIHFAVMKTNPVLFSILEKALSSVTSEEMDGLKQKWFSPNGINRGMEDVGLTPSEREWLNAKGGISFSVNPERMPFEAIHYGRLNGMASDYVELFQKKLGVPFFLIHSGSFEESVESIKTGKSDSMLMGNAASKMSTGMDFTSSYLSYSVCIIVQDSFPFISGVNDLKGRTVGITGYSPATQSLSDEYPGITFVTDTDTSESLLQVSSGSLDAMLMPLPVATYYIRQLGLNNLKIGGYLPKQSRIRIGVKKGNTQLHSILGKLIVSLSEQEINSIYNKWVSIEMTPITDYSIIWKTFAVASVVIFLFILWNRKLARLNRKIATANKTIATKSLELEHLSITDSLTALFNRRHLEEILPGELDRAHRYSRNLSLIMMDVDHFKSVNDTYGHHAGDRVLIRIAQILMDNVRNSDTVGRWGGEEFIIICPETNLDGAASLAESLRQTIEETALEIPESRTASFGVATCNKNDTVESLLEKTDSALYMAKKNGRNRVETDNSG